MAVCRDGGGVESFAVVLHEGLDDAGAHLDVDGDGRGTVAHGVLAGLGQSRNEGKLARAGPHVADDNDADGHTVAALAADNGLGDSGLERVGGLRVARVQPGAQLTFLGQGDGAHARRVLGGGTNQGQRLKHGVVQVCGNVGALGLTHPLRLGLGQILRRT